MKLVHYSAVGIKKYRPVPNGKRGARELGDKSSHVGDKPKGLWVSDDDCEYNWRYWCEGEQWGLDRLIVKQDVSLRADAKVLLIQTVAELDDFTEKFSAPLYLGGHLEYINWKPVCEEYDGIVITPYLWERRFRPIWYYGWDCASGCIWGDAIERIGDQAECSIASVA